MSAHDSSVKARLTQKRVVETPEYAAMVRRIIAAHGRRCADADPEDLAELVALRQAVDAAVQTAVDGLRDQGVSWSQIGAGLGITKQAAQAAWGRRVSPAKL